MHRSSSHIGSLQDYKPKSLWKSMLSKDGQNENNKSRGIIRSQSTVAHKSKRSSMIISEPSSIRNSGLKRLSLIPSSTDSSFDSENIDPKEKEFYQSLNLPTSATSSKFSNRHRSMYFGSTNSDMDDIDSLDFGSKSPISSNFINMNEDKEPDMLSSALEDYKIFTTTKKSTNSSTLTSANPTPTNLTFEESELNSSNLNNNDDDENSHETRETRMSSLPSFTSTNTMESEISVLHVSNSLWIGSTITDYDLDDEDKFMDKDQIDYFEGFNPENIFDDEKIESTNRTSLIFI
ncbi:Autophagy-related protein [Wickerhamomyces ciferrii]|uniref:Autophagy-related protein n=1 Tax=Wickerhamomyces ciferrii (strain ATCC 14091 / BCRC 22168 / CBS 111 / JCM 3599 / NBRC 0793 / NRRL Y-1031 F-60-10) TaxID=1206466 RepID=K0KBF9_WICCF|nr:Autophagy-related protein [Wickerhamomyces ciferrii]CCH42355.1 Autophagy-related protein [Wickerhamomyces ciferrii]